MPTYISLSNWTSQGIENLKEAPQRMDVYKKTVEASGGKLIGFYFTMGKYDIVSIIDAPSDEALANIILKTGSRGSVRSETMKAFTEQEFRNILAKM